MYALLLALLAPPAPVDPAVAIPPRQRSGTILADDYPLAAIQAGEEGQVRMRLRVGPAGTVVGCEVIDSSGSAVLDATSCSLVRQRFKYKPAQDADGRAVASTVPRTVTWRLPADTGSDLAAMLPAFGAGEMRLAMVVDDVGPRCAIEVTGTAWAMVSPLACPQEARASFAEIAAARNAMMTVTTLVPEGEAAAPRPPVAGTLVARAASELEVDGRGALASCRDVAIASPSPLPSFCQALNSGAPIFRPGAAGQVRRGRVTIELYRLGGSGQA